MSKPEIKKKEPFKITYQRLLVIPSIILGILTLVFSAYFSYMQAVNSMNLTIENTDTDELVQANESLDDIFNKLLNVSAYISSESELVTFFEEKSPDWSGPRTVFINSLTKTYSRIIDSTKFIRDILYVDKDGNFIYPNSQQIQDYPDVTDKEELLRQLRLFTDTIQGKPVSTYYSYKEGQRHCIITPVVKHGRLFGAVALVIDPIVFTSVVNSDAETDKGFETLILSSDNSSIFNTINPFESQAMTIKTMIQDKNTNLFASVQSVEGKGFTAHYIKNSLFGWNIIRVWPSSIKTNKLLIIIGIFSLVFAFSILFILLLSGVIARKLLAPIRTLLRFVRHYNIGAPFRKHLKRGEAHAGFQFNILYFMLATVLVPNFIFLSLANVATINLAKDNYAENTTSILGYTMNRLNTFIENKMIALKDVALNTDMQNYIIQRMPDAKKQVENTVDEYLAADNSLDDIAIYDSNSKLVYSNKTNIEQARLSFAEISTNSNFYLWGDVKKDKFGENYIELYAKINTLSSFERLGYVYCGISELSFESKYRGFLKDKVNAYIVDKDLVVFSHKDKNLIGQKINPTIKITDSREIKKGEDYLMVFPIQNCDLDFVASINTDSLFEDINQFTYGKIYIFGMIMLMVLFVSYIFIYNSTYFLRKFHSLLEKNSIDNVAVVFPEESKISEISELGTVFNEMIARNDKLLESLLISTKLQAELHETKRDAELIALQAQINPHFLYNTFDCISWMIKCEEKEKAVLMISSLSEMFRYVTKSETMLVPIAKEIEYVELYIYIMKIRYGRNLRVDMGIPEKYLTYKTLKLILQPFIENSINHGMIRKKDGFKIRISCREEGQSLIFRITDNGQGIAPDELERLNTELSGNAFYNRVGLINVQNRVRLKFGDDYRINITSKPGKGTTAEIRIPALPDMEEPSEESGETLNA